MNVFSRLLKRAVFTACVSLLVLLAAQAALAHLSVKEFGARGDGKTLDTKAIQKAIDTVSTRGGGTVFFPAGRYLSGTLFLKNYVSLYLDAGSVILGSTNLKDYPVTMCTYRSYTDNYTERSLIYAERVQHVSILGQGIVDGQGEVFGRIQTRSDPAYKKRPYLFRFIECKNVMVRDITIVNSPMWVQHYLACEDVVIDGVRVNSLVAGNNDGIDIDSYNGVRISNCSIRSVDDSIVLKATSDRPCKNVVVTNCVLSSRCNAFKLGTESNGGFENITFCNSVIHNTGNAAVTLQMVDGGRLERVCINNIVMNNCGTAIFIRLGNRARPFLSKGPGGARGTWKWERKEKVARPGIGSLRVVTISNIQATGIGVTGCSISGIPNHPVEDITLHNVRLTFVGGGNRELIDRVIPEEEEAYPRFTQFGRLPSYGIFVRHASDITFENVQVDYDKADQRPAFVFEDVVGFDLVRVNGTVEPETPACMIMDGVSHALVTGCRPSGKMKCFIDARNSSRISILHNDLTNAAEPVKRGKGTANEDIFMAGNRK